jgi:hypothetical protein
MPEQTVKRWLQEAADGFRRDSSIRGHGHGPKSYADRRDELAKTQLAFLETDLSMAVTFADIAKRHYEQRNSQDGDRCKGQAENALKTVRYFIKTTDLLTGPAIDLLAKRCEELERIVATLNQAE